MALSIKNVGVFVKNKSLLVTIIITGILIKILLFYFVLLYAPQSRFMYDSSEYLKTAQVLASKGAFATQDPNGGLRYEIKRTPGYPLFLGILNGLMKIPLSGVIFIQVLLTILTAAIVYKTAVQIEPRLGFLSAVIVLYSPIIAVFSLMILTEILFLFFLTLFMFYFIKYLLGSKSKDLILSSLALVLAAYIRPGVYFLGFVIFFFILYANVTKNLKKTLGQAFVFLIIVYVLLGLWQVRNYMHCGQAVFSSILFHDPFNFGLYKSYSREASLFPQPMPPFLYYIDATWRCFLSLMTRPGSFKYFDSHTLNILTKVLCYPWMVFWITGFLFGILKAGKNICYHFLLLVIACFVGGSIIAEMWFVGERFRVPISAFISIISAYGWIQLFPLISSYLSRIPFINQSKDLKNAGQIINFKRLLISIFLVLFLTLLIVVIWFQDQYVVSIMMYHSVSLSDAGPLNSVTPQAFENQMAFLKKNHYRVISLNDLIEGKRRNKKFSHKTVVITFDDGYQDNFKYAYPVLRKYNFPATIFLISDLVGVAPQVLTWPQIKEMNENGINFGSHTRHHAYLPDISQEQLKDEIVNSKRIIEEHLGKSVYSFSYPIGGFSEKIKSVVARAGYLAAVTTNRGSDRYDVDPYELNRVRIKSWDSPLVLCSKLSGYYNFFRELKSSH